MSEPPTSCPQNVTLIKVDLREEAYKRFQQTIRVAFSFAEKYPDLVNQERL